jgi:hypothetical protein
MRERAADSRAPAPTTLATPAVSSTTLRGLVTGRSAPTPDASTVRALQRLAGNRAVTSLINGLRRRTGPLRRRTVQRYGSSEHMDAGDAATTRALTLDLWTGPPNPLTQTKKVTLSYGTANALLGDFYTGWAQLKKAPAPEVERLAALIKQEQTARASGKPLPAESDYEQATAARRTGALQPGGDVKTYLELAEGNVDHYTPSNRDHFARQHKAALAKALEALALKNKGDTAGAQAATTEAFGLNAEADHFLEDAFAAGHLINKPMIQLATLQFWTSGVGRAAGDNLRAAAASDQARIWREIETHVLPGLSTTERIAMEHVLDRQDAINRVINRILDTLQDQPDKLANLGAKLVHDHLNTNGVMVFNEADPSTGWRTFGDNFLAKGVTASKLATALKASVANIELAATSGIGAIGGKTDIDAFLRTNNPWQFAPKWAEVPVGQRREVGVAMSDPAWVQDLLRTQVFRNDTKSPLYQLLLDNLALVSGILAEEERKNTARRTTQATAADALLRKHSKSFAKGGTPDDANIGALARALRGAAPDLVVTMLERLEPADLDDDLAEEFTDLHGTRSALSALDASVLLALRSAMRGGITGWGEQAAIDRITAALLAKTGEQRLSEVPAKERGAAKKILAGLNARPSDRAAADSGAADLWEATRRDVYRPKDLAVEAKGQAADVVLGAIDMMIFDEERSKWLVPYAAAFTDAEIAALDVALVESVAKHLPRGAQQRRFAQALAAATKAGAIAKTTGDISKGQQMIDRFKFTDHPKLAGRLKGRSPALVAAALDGLVKERPAVAAEFVKQHSDDELAAFDPALLHQLAGWVSDATQHSRVTAALSKAVANAGTRSGV